MSIGGMLTEHSPATHQSSIVLMRRRWCRANPEADMVTTPLSPEAIERAAERAMDRIDGRLLRGEITPTEYDATVRALDAITRRQHAAWERHATMADWPKMEG